MLEEWLYLQPRGENREREMDGENGWMGYRGAEEKGEEEEGDGVRVEDQE